MSYEQVMVGAAARMKSAFDQLAQAAAEAAIALQGWGVQMLTSTRVAAARRMAGGTADPYSDDWQCGPCSGWLHEACRNPEQTKCRCTCRGGHLR